MSDADKPSQATPLPDPFLGDASTDGSSELDLSKFFTAARDKKGFSTTVRLNVPPTVTGKAAEMVAKRLVPEYRTTADVYRDCIVIGMALRAQQIDHPDFQAMYTALITESRMERVLAEIEAEHRVVKLAERAFEETKGALGHHRDEVMDIALKALEAMQGSVARPEMEALLQRFTEKGTEGEQREGRQ